MSAVGGRAMGVRYAEARDVAAIVDLVRRAQDKLTATGSLQGLTLPSFAAVAAHVAARTAHVLDGGRGILGSVFVEPAAVRRRPELARWGLDDGDAAAYPLWFLHTLVIDPDAQGRGLGRVLLDGVKRAVARDGPATIVLDCWAGNDTLRAFYANAGFRLHGVFPERGHAVAVFVWGVCDGCPPP